MKPLLIVEDDDDLRDAYIEVLQAAGFSVIASDEGRKALELANVIKPSAISLDLHMHGMDGWEFLRERTRYPNAARAPVVVTTGVTAPDVAADMVLMKPFELTDLVAAVRKVTQRRAER